jgi:hypothetical protein
MSLIFILHALLLVVNDHGGNSMVRSKNDLCPYCGGELQSRGKVKRKIRIENGKRKTIYISRYSCKQCGRWHRVLPSNYIPYKQYAKNVVRGFKEGIMSDANLEWENYPSESTKKRWSRIKQ